jgi:hypothetical protein
VPLQLRASEASHACKVGKDGAVVVQFEKFPKDSHSGARHCGARNLLFRRWQQADSSPIKLASEIQGVALFLRKMHHDRWSTRHDALTEEPL